MRELFEEKKPLYISDTILRDAHQSHAATRMRVEDMLPACEILDSIGYWSLECWGGATFDACMRYLDEDPWERLRLLRKALPHTKLQMLLRGRNLLGYRHYADDVIDAFCRKAIENGIDVVRIFDALNDVDNMQTAMKSVGKYGGIVEAAICYTKSPVHSEKYFVDKAVELEQSGADVICIKDMANLLLPAEAYSLIKKLKARLSVPVHLHTHDTAGTGEMVYLAAAIAGVDIVDCALSPFANGTSQPATEALVAAMTGTARDTGLNPSELGKAASHFAAVARKLEEEGMIDAKVLRIFPDVLRYQVPGGMLSNLLSQLRQAGAIDKTDAVLREIAHVRKDFGYPPLVTPISQIIGTQAVLNVMAGRYARFTKEAKDLLRGEYGRLPGTVDKEIYRRAIGDTACAEKENAAASAEANADRKPHDRPRGEALRKQFQDVAKTEEDVLSCAMFPQLAPDFIKRRDDTIVHEIEVEMRC